MNESPQPHAPSHSPTEAPPKQGRKRRLHPFELVGVGIGVFVLTWVVEMVAGQWSSSFWTSGAIGILGFGAASVLAGWGMARSIASLRLLPSGTLDAASVLGTVLISMVSLAMMGIGALSAFFATVGFARGRQLRRFERVLLPPVGAGNAWTTAGYQLEDAASAPPGLAQRWRENGRTEHASVASFARLTLDLMALGAPPALVAAANQDALDEIRHTEACFSLARAIDGRTESPGPFPEAQSAHTLPRTRTLALATLAVNSLIDGALHEGVSARVIAKLARRAEQPLLREVLKQIAADEGRHAAHGWDVVEWCLGVGGQPVAHALLGALRVLPREMHSDLPADASGGAWEPWGIHGHALESEEYRAARAHVVARVQALTLGDARAA